MSVVKDNLLAEHNAYRKRIGRPLLKKDATLTKGAQRVADLYANANRGIPGDHSRPGGTSYNTWWSNYYRGTHAMWAPASENLGVDWRTTRSLMGCTSCDRTWLGSSTHRQNVGDRRFRRVGFGHAISRNGRNYWVAHYAD